MLAEKALGIPEIIVAHIVPVVHNVHRKGKLVAERMPHCDAACAIQTRPSSSIATQGSCHENKSERPTYSKPFVYG
jgi:hypothetical protein